MTSDQPFQNFTENGYKQKNATHSDRLIDEQVQRFRKVLASGRLSPKTVEIYSHGLNGFSRFLADRERTSPRQIRPQDLEDYRQALLDRSLSPSSIHLYLRTVRSFLSWLEEQRILFVSPAHGLILPAPKRPLMPTPTRKDVARMLQSPDTRTLNGIRDRALLETVYATGARVGELQSMTLQSVHLNESTVRLMGKGDKERVVPLGKNARRWLQRYQQEARPRLLNGAKTTNSWWISQAGQPLSYPSYRAIILRHGKAPGIDPPIRPHGLRRACATHMLQNGANPLDIAELLGHASMKSLSQYLRLTIREIQHMHQDTQPGQ